MYSEIQLVLLLSLPLSLGAPPQNSSEQCKKYVHSIYYMCYVTVFHLGDLPAVEELDNNERSRRALQPLLCPCPQGYMSWLCPAAVQEMLALFQHDVLCNSDFELDSDLELDSNLGLDSNLELDSNLKLDSDAFDAITSITTEDLTTFPLTETQTSKNYDKTTLLKDFQVGIPPERRKDYDTNSNVIGVD